MEERIEILKDHMRVPEIVLNHIRLENSNAKLKEGNDPDLINRSQIRRVPKSIPSLRSLRRINDLRNLRQGEQNQLHSP